MIRGYLKNSPSHSGSLNGSRTTPTGQSAIKEQSERLKEEISRREHEMKQVVDILEKTYEECHKKLEERLSQEQVAKEQDLGGKKVVVDRPCGRVRELVEQREKVDCDSSRATVKRSKYSEYSDDPSKRTPKCPLYVIHGFTHVNACYC